MNSKSKEIELRGIAAAPGISISSAYLYFKEKEVIKKEAITDVEEAKKNLQEAIEKSKKELNKVLSLALDKLGEKRSAIFEAQIMILDDAVLIDKIFNRIEEEKLNPEYIVDDEISKYQKLMSSSEGIYMKERSRDIEDIKNRIIRNVKKKKWKSRIKKDVVLVTDSLTPADALLFHRQNVMGYVTNFGGLTSHATILARSLKIPAVLGIREATVTIDDDDEIIVDGFNGKVFVNPSEETLNSYREKLKILAEQDEELKKLKDLPAVTKDGREIKILANLDIQDEVNFVIENGASGVGLIRTEQILEEFEEFPDEEEQLKIYETFSEQLYPRNITIRVMDIGGDKVLPFDIKEGNPFLGWRGIRFLNDNISLFKTQVRAILRASKHKNIKLLLPMITSIYEIRKALTVIEESKKELRAENIEFDEYIKVGIMIEIPSAAIMVKEFSAEVDFISIGSNDLIQYLLAVDRGNEIIQELYQEFHPAVIRMLSFIIEEGNKAGNDSVSLCGEMAADFIATPLLIGLGLKVFSVSASVIPLLKKVIRELDYSETVKLAEECLELKTENEIKDKVKKFYKEKLKSCTLSFD